MKEKSDHFVFNETIIEGESALGRHTVAAVLSVASGDVPYNLELEIELFLQSSGVNAEIITEITVDPMKAIDLMEIPVEVEGLKNVNANGEAINEFDLIG